DRGQAEALREAQDGFVALVDEFSAPLAGLGVRPGRAPVRIRDWRIRVHPTTDAGGCFVNGRADPGILQCEGCREPRDTGADDSDTWRGGEGGLSETPGSGQRQA